MLTAGQAAALIAAISFAVLAGAGVYALVKLARLISEASRTVAQMRERTDLLVGRANAAVDQAHEQLARTGEITANMDDVSSNIAELTADVSMLTGAVRTVLGGPLGRFAELTYGVRRAIALRRADSGATRRRDAAGRRASSELGDGRVPASAHDRHLGSQTPAPLPPPATGNGSQPKPAVPAQRRTSRGHAIRGRRKVTR